MQKTAKPSILVLTRTIPPVYGSAGRLARDLCRVLAREGYTVTLLSTAPGKKPALRRGHLRVIRLPGTEKPKGFWGYAWVWMRMLHQALKLPAHDIVITLTDPPLLLLVGQWVARVKGSKHVHWCHHVYPDLLQILQKDLPSWMVNWMQVSSRKAMKSADALVPVSKCMSRHLAHTGMETRKLHTIENWPDPELAGHSIQWLQTGLEDEKSRKLKKPLPSPQKMFSEPQGAKFRVLYAGTINKAHPMETVLTAAKALHGRHNDIEFTFVGKGEGFERIAAYRSKHGLDNIRILPPQPRFRLKALMESGDIHLISLADDAAGLMMPSKLYSALAVERPIAYIGPHDCHVAGIVEKYQAGQVIAHGDPQKLASMVRSYRMDATKWHAAHEGIKEAAKDRMPEAPLDAWKKLIGSLTN